MKPVCRKSYNLKATAENSPLISNFFRSMLQKMVKWLTSSFMVYRSPNWHAKENMCVCENSILLVFHPRETLALQWILSSTGAFGWKTPKDRTNSPNSITPLRLTSNKSKICRSMARRCNLGKRENAMESGNYCYTIGKRLHYIPCLQKGSSCFCSWIMQAEVLPDEKKEPFEWYQHK